MISTSSAATNVPHLRKLEGRPAQCALTSLPFFSCIRRRQNCLRSTFSDLFLFRFLVAKHWWNDVGIHAASVLLNSNSLGRTCTRSCKQLLDGCTFFIGEI